jgi:hypothetical protein
MSRIISSPSSIKIDFQIGILWFSNKLKLAALREKSYDKTINYSFFRSNEDLKGLGGSMN